MSVKVSRWGTVDLDGDDIRADLVFAFVRLFSGCGRFRFLGADDILALGWTWEDVGLDGDGDGDEWRYRIMLLERRGFECVT